MMTLPRREGAETYDYRGEEVYKDTGRPVGEKFGDHAILRIVEDPEAVAKSLEAEGDEQAGKWPKRHRHIAEQRRAERYKWAQEVRAKGAYREVRTLSWDAEHARRDFAAFRPTPGVRHELAEITEMRHCPLCHRPTFRVDGQWWHHTGNYPIGCTIRLPKLPERKPEPGEWVISTAGWMVCGYCGETESWAEAILGYWTLTGIHTLGVHVGEAVPGIPTNPGDLVVLAEATNLTGGTVMLPHACTKIPTEFYDKYRQDIQAALAERNSA